MNELFKYFYFLLFSGANKKEIIQSLEDIFGDKIIISIKPGTGAHITCFAYDSLNKNIAIVKIVHRRRGLILNRTNRIVFGNDFLMLSSRERLNKEYEIISLLSRHNLAPKPYKIGRNYLIEEFIEGKVFAQFNNSFDDDNYFNVIRKILKAIKRIHELNVFHMDIRPDNIIITPQGNIKFIDFEHFINQEKFSNFQLRALDYYYFIKYFVELKKEIKLLNFQLVLNEHFSYEDNNVLNAVIEMLNKDSSLSSYKFI